MFEQAKRLLAAQVKQLKITHLCMFPHILPFPSFRVLCLMSQPLLRFLGIFMGNIMSFCAFFLLMVSQIIEMGIFLMLLMYFWEVGFCVFVIFCDYYFMFLLLFAPPQFTYQPTTTDYVDRGDHSIETVLLLIALYVRYPKDVVLVRGNHEFRDLNSNYGFLGECCR